jgi:tetratricopeptide (TPR) repeat protein
LERRIRPDWESAAAGAGREAAWAEAGLALIAGDFDRARDLLGDPEVWDAALLRGYVETRRGAGNRDDAAGARAYQRALRGGIPMAWVHVNRGAMLNGLGDFAGALEEYDAALALDPGHPPARVNRARQLHRAERNAEALVMMNSLIAEHPRYLRATGTPTTLGRASAPRWGIAREPRRTSLGRCS